MAEKSSRNSMNFIENIIDDDLKNNRFGGRVHTRFPPEPNGKTFEELEDNFLRGEIFKPTKGKCVPAKPGKFRMMQTGFPDFIAYQMYDEEENFLDTGAIPKTKPIKMYKVIFVECKTNGYLSKEEKEKAQWYIKNNYCEEFWIAYKTKEKNRVLVNYKKLES